MTRNGKIARLPQPLREQINLRLQNGEEGKQVAAWLNTLPEVQAFMAKEFDGQPISEVNLSNWKLGGYRDWEEQQESLAAARRFAADAAELTQAGGAQLADQLALCLIARLAAAWQAPSFRDGNAAGQWERLLRLGANLARLRKGDHNAEWLRIQRGKLDLNSKIHEDEVAARTQNPNSRLLRADGGFTQETINKIIKDLHLL